jgi:hypothetical protein
MKKPFFSNLSVTLFLALVLPFAARAAGAADGANNTANKAPATSPVGAKTEKAAPKSQYNNQVYEKSSDEEQSFTAIVKVVREVQGETEVFFEGKQGFYTLGSGSQSLLNTSQKKKIPVSVSINPQNRQILKVELSAEGPGKPASGHSGH